MVQTILPCVDEKENPEIKYIDPLDTYDMNVLTAKNIPQASVT